MTTNAGQEFDALDWEDDGCNDFCAEMLVSRLCEICSAPFFVCPDHEASVEACSECS